MYCHVTLLLSPTVVDFHWCQNKHLAPCDVDNLVKILIWFSPGIVPAALFCFAARFVLWQNLPGTSSSSYLLPFSLQRHESLKKVEKLVEFSQNLVQPMKNVLPRN